MVEVDWIDLDGAFAALEDELTRVAQGLTVVAWDSLLDKTPQFYGRMVASWNYSIGQPDFTDRSHQAWAAHSAQTDRGPFAGLAKGHPVAIAIANANNIGRDSRFNLGDTVYFSNGVNHGEGPYSQAVEDGDVNLRAVNRPGRPAARTFDWLSQNYADVSAGQAKTLATKKLGASIATPDS